jgi:hypothetical protein
MSPHRKIFLVREQIYADLITEGAYVSRVQYLYGGMVYDILVENDEFEIIDDEEDEWREE